MNNFIISLKGMIVSIAISLGVISTPVSAPVVHVPITASAPVIVEVIEKRVGNTRNIQPNKSQEPIVAAGTEQPRIAPPVEVTKTFVTPSGIIFNEDMEAINIDEITSLSDQQTAVEEEARRKARLEQANRAIEETKNKIVTQKLTEKEKRIEEIKSRIFEIDTTLLEIPIKLSEVRKVIKDQRVTINVLYPSNDLDTNQPDSSNNPLVKEGLELQKQLKDFPVEKLKLQAELEYLR